MIGVGMLLVSSFFTFFFFLHWAIVLGYFDIIPLLPARLWICFDSIFIWEIPYLISTVRINRPVCLLLDDSRCICISPTIM